MCTVVVLHRRVRFVDVTEQVHREIVADQPEIFGMMANRIWGLRDYVKDFEYSPVRSTSEVDFYPMWIDA